MDSPQAASGGRAEGPRRFDRERHPLTTLVRITLLAGLPGLLVGWLGVVLLHWRAVHVLRDQRMTLRCAPGPQQNR